MLRSPSPPAALPLSDGSFQLVDYEVSHLWRRRREAEARSREIKHPREDTEAAFRRLLPLAAPGGATPTPPSGVIHISITGT
ncbi:hypothetical protein EYF80_059849 [Liparis tanakae]|uniref:Uncharacterized protein n=1 Tax=Liparis tanakae TaxID=230148 RepID=A0A4Z2EMC3_9TELE|nr:hypothetical protein EYF80_059849 [Liparis tanakae]